MTSATPQPLVDLHGLVAGILWRRRLWSAVALLGVLAGGLAMLVLPPKPTAVTRVIIVRDDETSTPETLMATDVALFDTTATAVAAMERLHIAKRPEDFLKTFDGVAQTPNVLKITAHGPSDADAARRARVLAEVFIADHVQRTRQKAEAQAQALLKQRAELQREHTEVTDQITTAQGDQLAALSQRRANLEAQIIALEQQASDARIGVPPVAAGTQIVDPPRARPNSLARAAVIHVAVGLVFGLTAGLSLAAVLCVTRDRPVLRRDIAAHLGVSVIVQLPAARRGLAGNHGRSARERQRAAGTLARVVRETPGSVSLLEVGCPRTAAALAVAIATELATDRPVTIVDHLASGHFENVHEPTGDHVGIIDVEHLTGRADGAVDQEAEPRELRLGVGSVGPGASWVDLDRLGSRALLVVRAGQASTLWLHTVARQLAHAGVSPIGVVLVRPYPWDGTDGTLWDGLHAALGTQHQTSATAGPPDRGAAPNSSTPAGLRSATEETRL